MNQAFWRGKRVFVTGHTGFKGSWLSLWLQSWGAEVHGFALAPPTSPSLFSVADVASGMASSTLGNICDAGAVHKALAAARPEIVIHMAAQSLVRVSYNDPLLTFATNVMGTAHVLDAARGLETVRCIVNITSDKCYENREWLWGYREDEPMGGHDPYSSSKGCAELLTAAYRRSFFSRADGVALASARAGNVIGGGDWAADRLVPDVLRAFANGVPVIVRNPQAVRPWQHVLEPLSAYLLLAERLWVQGQAVAEGWNFGPAEGDARPVRWIVERLGEMWGDGASWQQDATAQPHEAHLLRLDTSKARHRLAWHPRWDLSVALSCIVDWHRAWLAGDSMRSVCLKNIESFVAHPRAVSA